MKIAISSTGPTLDSTVEPRFGRCPYFLIVDPETLEFEALPNPNISLPGGAGPQSVQLVHEKGVSTVLTGSCGPNAIQAFGAINIELVTGVSGTVRTALEQFKSGKTPQSPIADNSAALGMGGGRGIGCGGGMRGGRGTGGGRGMGGGGGRGMGGGGMGGGGGRGMGGSGMNKTPKNR